MILLDFFPAFLDYHGSHVPALIIVVPPFAGSSLEAEFVQVHFKLLSARFIPT